MNTLRFLVIVGYVASVALIVSVFLIALLPLRSIPSSTRRVVRDRRREVRGWVGTGVHWICPYFRHLAESFSLTQSSVHVRKRPCDTVDEFVALSEIAVFYTVDPAAMDPDQMQSWLDSLGDNPAEWKKYVMGLLLEALNEATTQMRYRFLRSAAGQQALRGSLMAGLTERTAGSGVIINDISIYRVQALPALQDHSRVALAQRQSARYVSQMSDVLGSRFPGARPADLASYLHALAVHDAALHHGAALPSAMMMPPYSPGANGGNGRQPGRPPFPNRAARDEAHQQAAGG